MAWQHGFGGDRVARRQQPDRGAARRSRDRGPHLRRPCSRLEAERRAEQLDADLIVYGNLKIDPVIGVVSFLPEF
jgi:hypothetical protein